MTPQEYQAWLQTLKGQSIKPLWETVDAGQAESATPEGRQQAYLLDPEGNKFYLQQQMEQQAEASSATPTGGWMGSGLQGNYYENGAKGGTFMDFTSNADGTLSASGDSRQVLGNDESWWTMWRPIVILAATAALSGYAAGADGGASGWVSAEGGAGYAGGMAADSSALADAAAVGSDWSQGAATTNGSQGVYNTDAGMNALSEVGAGYEVPAAQAGYGAGAANTSAAAPIVASTPSVVNAPTSSNTGAGGLGSSLANLAQTAVGGTNWGQLLGSVLASYQNGQTANNLLDLFKQYQQPASEYGSMLMDTYKNPSGYLNSPEYQAVQNTTGDYLQRKDAAGGGLSNNTNRQLLLNNQAYDNLAKYRTGLNDTYKNLASISTGAGAQDAIQAQGNQYNPLLSQLGKISSTGTTGA